MMSVYSIFQIFPRVLEKKSCQTKVELYIISKPYCSSHYLHTDSKLLCLTSQTSCELSLLYTSSNFLASASVPIMKAPLLLLQYAIIPCTSLLLLMPFLLLHCFCSSASPAPSYCTNWISFDCK